MATYGLPACSRGCSHLRVIYPWLWAGVFVLGRFFSPLGPQLRSGTCMCRPPFAPGCRFISAMKFICVCAACLSHYTRFASPAMHRGKFRSKPWASLLEEAKYLVESGVVELNLIAEDTNQYGQDRKDGKGLAQVQGVHNGDPRRVVYARGQEEEEEDEESFSCALHWCSAMSSPLWPVHLSSFEGQSSLFLVPAHGEPICGHL